ncbi:divalent-cation tolerance protein CutA [bacterium]|nr:MAG: divalent-cation tolerance protein CutA [bacterium]
MATPYSVVFVTVPDQKTADALAEGMVKAKLAACVNIVPGVTSTYYWEGKLERSAELLLIVKTRADLMAEVCDHVKKNHPYKTPEVLATTVEDGHAPYLDWVGARTRYARPDPRRGRGG